MTSEIKRMHSQLRRAFEGEAWHGPSVMELLGDVTAEEAAARPVAGAHTIWELALHIGTWEEAARRQISGEPGYRPSDEENFPAAGEGGEAAWRETLERLRRINAGLREALRGFDETRLDEQLEGQPYSAYFLLHGVIQHDLYHAGQIALLKRALRA